MAFLVGKISDVVASTETEGRFKILISEFASLALSEGWEEGRRNPVAYYKDHEFTDAGKPIDFKALRYQKLDVAVQGLTIAQAKAGLAAAFNLPASAMEITIRA